MQEEQKNRLTTYPEGVQMLAETLDFLPEEARIDFILAAMMDAMMK